MASRNVTLRFKINYDPNPFIGLAHIARVLLWRHGHVNKQLTRYAYPGQPSTRARTPVKRCTCLYWAARTPDTHIETLTHTLIPTYGLPAISWIHIDPWCPHHGHAAYDPDLWRQANPPLITGI